MENERAKKCYKELLKPKIGSRIYPPSNSEINAIRVIKYNNL